MQYEPLHKKPKPTDEFHCTTSVSESKRWISIVIMGLMHQLIIYIVCLVQAPGYICWWNLRF